MSDTATKELTKPKITDGLDIAVFGIPEEEIEELSERYMPLVVQDEHDKEGMAIVRAARIDVRDRRVAIDKARKELNKDALAYQRTVNSLAKVITDRLTPIEEHLQAQENIVKEAEERRKREAEEKRRAVVIERVKELAALGVHTDTTTVEAQSDSDYADWLAHATKEHQAKVQREEAERKALEEAQQREALGLARAQRLHLYGVGAVPEELAELTEEAFLDLRDKAKAEHEETIRLAQEAKAREQLAWERRGVLQQYGMHTDLDLGIMDAAAFEELAAKAKAEDDERRAHNERLAAERKAEEQRLAAEREKLEADRRELEKQQAAEQARQAERERIEREKLEAELHAKQIAEAKAREEALRPDREKLLAFADLLLDLTVPCSDSEDGDVRDAVLAIRARIDMAAEAIREIVEGI